MRIAALVCACACVLAAYAGEPRLVKMGPLESVDLTAPGAMQRLQDSDPARYHDVVDALKRYEQMPCEPRELGTLASRLDPAELACGVQLYTSYPPKRDVTVVVAGIAYRALVAMQDARGALLPASR